MVALAPEGCASEAPHLSDASRSSTLLGNPLSSSGHNTSEVPRLRSATLGMTKGTLGMTRE